MKQVCYLLPGQEFNYRLGTVNSKSFVGKVLLRIKRNFELTVYFKHGILGKLYKNISQYLRIKWNFELTVFELTVPDLYLCVTTDRDFNGDTGGLTGGDKI